MIADYIRTPDGKILFTNVKEGRPNTEGVVSPVENKNTN